MPNKETNPSCPIPSFEMMQESSNEDSLISFSMVVAANFQANRPNNMISFMPASCPRPHTQQDTLAVIDEALDILNEDADMISWGISSSDYRRTNGAGLPDSWPRRQ